MNPPIHSIPSGTPAESSGADHPFDAVAAAYDDTFSNTPLGLYKRGIVHRCLASIPVDRYNVLELNCGTGLDALWLASHGCRVTATDASGGMIEVARRRLENSPHTASVRFRQMRIEELVDPEVRGEIGRVDLIFSDFDGINCLESIETLPDIFSDILTPKGAVILVYMNPVCAIEILGNLLRLRPSRAFARLRRGGIDVHIGEGRSIRTWFHPVRSVLQLFSRRYDLRAVRSVGLLAPPTSMRAFVQRHPRLIARLAPLDQLLSRFFPFNRLGDHVLLHFQQRHDQQ